MNSHGDQLWLVRTSSGEILGPFRQSDLQSGLTNDLFTVSDEIAPPNAPWMRANLLLSSSDEVTRTSTRNQTLSHPTVSMSGSAAPQLSIASQIPEPKLAPPVLLITSDNSKSVLHKIAPFLLGSILVLGIWSLLVQSRGTSHRVSPLKHEEENASSEFMKTIYGLVLRGESSSALEKLRWHHQAPSPSDYPEYSIVMAALEIVSDQNTGGAKRALTQIISEETTTHLRSAAHRWLGYLMLAKDEGDMGENHFLESLQLDPKNSAARFNLGRAYLKQERFIQALDYFQLAELEQPELWLIHIYKGRARSELGQFQQAENHFRRAVDLEPDRWISHIYYALFLAGRQEMDSAQRILNQMILRDSQFEYLSPPPWGFFQEKTNYGEYLSVYSHISANLTPSQRTLGKTLIQFASTSTASPDVLSRLTGLAKQGETLAQLGLLKAALTLNDHNQVQEQLASLRGDLIEYGANAYTLRARGLALVSKPQEAEKEFKLALSIDPTNAAAHWAYAEFLGGQGRPGEMAQLIRNLLNFHPGYIPAIVANLK